MSTADANGSDRARHTQPVSIRVTVFTRPDGSVWLRYPGGRKPVAKPLGWRSVLARRLTMTAYRRYRYRSVNWVELTDDERWAAAVSVHTRDVAVSYYRFETMTAAAYLRAVNCPPNGYRLQPYTGNKTGWYCGRKLCLHCHVRAAVDATAALLRAWRLRPAGSTVYVGRWAGTGVADHVADMARVRRVAAAVVFRAPTTDPTVWYHRVVMLSDDRRRLVGMDPVIIYKPWDVVEAAAASFRYPIWWAARPAKVVPAVLAVVARKRAWSTYGACRADYEPGRMVLDYAANEPKG